MNLKILSTMTALASYNGNYGSESFCDSAILYVKSLTRTYQEKESLEYMYESPDNHGEHIMPL